MCAYVCMGSSTSTCLPSPPNPLSHQKNLAKITNIFDIQQRSTGLIARKVFSSNLAHISTCSLCPLSQVAAHHKTTGVVFITLGLIRFLTMYNSQFSILTSYIDYHIVLSTTSYPTILCLSIHHAWLSGFLIIGSGAHASIFNLRASPTAPARYRDVR